MVRKVIEVPLLRMLLRFEFMSHHSCEEITTNKSRKKVRDSFLLSAATNQKNQIVLAIKLSQLIIFCDLPAHTVSMYSVYRPSELVKIVHRVQLWKTSVKLKNVRISSSDIERPHHLSVEFLAVLR